MTIRKLLIRKSNKWKILPTAGYTTFPGFQPHNKGETREKIYNFIMAKINTKSKIKRKIKKHKSSTITKVLNYL